MKIIKTIYHVFYPLIIIFLFTLGAALSASLLNLPGNYKLFTVQSGSMEPAIHTGAVIFTQPVGEYKVKDVIAFKSPEDANNPNPKTTTTHRINDIKDGKFQTKGDANDAPDGTLVDPTLVVGKVLFSIPFLGYPISFARTQTGLIVLIIIPATIIIYGEILNIKKEILRLIAERKNAPKSTHEESRS